MTTVCVNPACPQPTNEDSAIACAACGQPLLVDDRYRCQRVLGQGGFGRTYLAIAKGHNPPLHCVVKQMAPAVKNNRSDASQRFHREADRLATLGQHPQIPALLDVIDNAQGQFLVQEHIPGSSLDEFVPQPPDGGEALVQRVLYELLPVLAYIHDHSVIHRDIKPANIIAPPSPQPLALVDFGAAKAILDPEQLKHTATVIGSAGYAAPEQALGKAVFASDIFSLGVTCLHLLTGLHPFDLYSVSDDAWVWRPYAPASVSPALGRVLDRMVNRRLSERYSTAQEVLADLRWSGLALSAAAPFAPALPRGTESLEVAWEQRFALNLPGTVANGLAMSPSGRAIAAACSDGTVRLWDCTNGQAIHTFGKSLGLLGLGHRGPVRALVFTSQGDAIVSGGEDGQLIQWRLVDYSGQKLPLSGWQISALLIIPQTGTLAVGSGDGRIHLWPLEGSHAPKTLVHHQDQVTALAVDFVGNLLVSGGCDRTLRLWSLPTGRLVRTLTAPKHNITALACHPHDGRIVSGDQMGQVQVWSAENPDQGLVIHKSPSPVTAITISPNGHWLAIGADNGHLTLINLQGQGQTIQLRHAWTVRAIAFTPDSRMIVSTSADETIRFWCWVNPASLD
ncbi:serine/threonine protein kinase [Nodosilinea sp. LEGE 06152]|uniref:serine/threonine-protein kinase n=1 Tax=Nodosilinea sp. LEGE 06152 TaxID=2777966 RepID=UPI001881920D|nr:serine/threonine-protein kinase [Nodosilinea sp. LEGE 06152]MBE9159002.1 serine/threonine protein kinase [Nodosilinea sp. LEGE 06152]